MDSPRLLGDLASKEMTLVRAPSGRSQLSLSFRFGLRHRWTRHWRGLLYRWFRLLRKVSDVPSDGELSKRFKHRPLALTGADDESRDRVLLDRRL